MDKKKNIFTGFFSAPFQKNVNLYDLIKEKINNKDIEEIIHLGIKCKSGTVLNIDNKSIEVGETEMLEWNNCFIKKIYFEENIDKNASILYQVKIKI